MAQVKLDVLSFGILLLRLFCRRSVPQDDDTLIKWVSTYYDKIIYIILHHDHSRIIGLSLK